MKAYKYGDIIIPENKLNEKLKKYGITMEDLIPLEEKNKIISAEEEYPFTYRVNVNTVLCAYSQEELDKLKKAWKIE